MLKFEADKTKKIQMMVEATGIDSNKLKFTFVIDTGSVSYGFPCSFNEGKVEVEIPALGEVIKHLNPGTYHARLDVTGEDKYYLNPFNESIEIKQTPTIKQVDMKVDDGLSESLKVAVSRLIEVDEVKDEKKVEETKEAPEVKKEKSGLSSFFSKK